jgi:hypothetical protein
MLALGAFSMEAWAKSQDGHWPGGETTTALMIGQARIDDLAPQVSNPRVRAFLIALHQRRKPDHSAARRAASRRCTRSSAKNTLLNRKTGPYAHIKPH